MIAGQTYGEATGHRGMVNPSGDDKKFRQRLRSTDNDFSQQIEIVRDGVTHYHEDGIYPAPFYAWRITIIVRKAKAYSPFGPHNKGRKCHGCMSAVGKLLSPARSSAQGEMTNTVACPILPMPTGTPAGRFERGPGSGRGCRGYPRRC